MAYSRAALIDLYTYMANLILMGQTTKNYLWTDGRRMNRTPALLGRLNQRVDLK